MRVFSLILVLLSLAAVPVTAAGLIPKIANAGFEETVTGSDTPGWGWQITCSARFRSDTTNPHSGKRCVVFTNDTELTPNAFGRFYQGVGVRPGTDYELSAWVRAESTTGANHFTDWGSCTLSIPGGTYDWKRISVVFRTKNDQNSLNLGINIVDKCKDLAIDDISLRPIGIPLKGQGIEGSYLMQQYVMGDDAKTPLIVTLNSSLDSPATLQATIKDGGSVLFTKSGEIKPGANEIEWEWNSGKTTSRKLDFALSITDSQGKTVASAAMEIGKASPRIILADLDKIQARLDGEFSNLYRQCRSKKIPLDYPTAAKTLLEQFIPYAREDASHGQDRRADFMVTDLNRALDESIAEMKGYIKNPSFAPIARRYKTSKVTVDGVSFVGDRIDAKGKTDNGPLFFCGYGHFSQIRKDMPLWPGYGINIVQSAEFGPSAVFPEEGKTDMKAVNTLIETLDNAAKNNVKVDWLMSPHYFPAWPMAKWPHLGSGGFVYVIDAPEAKKVIEDFLRVVIPLIKDKPALHSICLTNEPTFTNSTTCYNTRPLWNEYLARVHGNIETVNKLYRTNYKSFDEVPVGGGFDDPHFYDYCMFNKERFAAWHKWMSDIIHSMAPDVPTHAKLCMILEQPSRNFLTWGVDPEMFANSTDINGNDCYIGLGSPINWQFQNFIYDLQRSMAAKPIFNSENHPTGDGSTNYVPPEHFRTALWQGAVHGQGATTIWIWERTRPWLPTPEWSFYGNVMDRPGCALATGTTCLDLNRFADEVTALEKKQAPVAIFYPKPSIMRNAACIDAMNRVHESLNFCGVKIDFISENQLAAGKGGSYKMIVLPQATHVTDAAFKALLQLPEKTKLVICGDGPQKDPYNNAFPSADADSIKNRATVLDGSMASLAMWPRMLEGLKSAGGLPSISVVDAATEQPVWGVEWLPATLGKRVLVNMVNLTSKPIDVKILSQGKQVQATNLLSRVGPEKVKRLTPVVPVLAEVGK